MSLLVLRKVTCHYDQTMPPCNQSMFTHTVPPCDQYNQHFQLFLDTINKISPALLQRRHSTVPQDWHYGNNCASFQSVSLIICFTVIKECNCTPIAISNTWDTQILTLHIENTFACSFNCSSHLMSYVSQLADLYYQKMSKFRVEHAIISLPSFV